MLARIITAIALVFNSIQSSIEHVQLAFPFQARIGKRHTPRVCCLQTFIFQPFQVFGIEINGIQGVGSYPRKLVNRIQMIH